MACWFASVLLGVLVWLYVVLSIVGWLLCPEPRPASVHVLQCTELIKFPHHGTPGSDCVSCLLVKSSQYSAWPPLYVVHSKASCGQVVCPRMGSSRPEKSYDSIPGTAEDGVYVVQAIFLDY